MRNSTLLGASAIMALFALVPQSALAQEHVIAEEVNDSTYVANGILLTVRNFPSRDIIVTGITSAARATTTNLDLNLLISIPSSGAELPITEIAANALKDDTNIKSVNFPNTLESIDESAFDGTDLSTVTIPSSVTTIGENAFANTPIKTVTIYGPEDDSSQTLSIGDGAFNVNPASGFTDCYITYRDAPTISGNVFSGAHYATLHYLPDLTTDQEDAYHNNTGWVDFWQKTQTGVDNIVADATEAAPEYYTLTGTRVMADSLTSGLYIVRQGQHTGKTLIR